MDPHYDLVSTVRATHNRTQRASGPTRLRFKQYVGAEQVRLIRGRKTRVTGDFIQKNLDELRDKEAQHILEVRNLNGERLDLTTLTVVSNAPVSPAPVFKLDSAKDDDNANRGRYIPSMIGDDEAVTAPSLLAQKNRDVELMSSEEDVKATAASAAEEEVGEDAPEPVFEQLPLSASSQPADTMKPTPPPAPPAPQKAKKKF